LKAFLVIVLLLIFCGTGYAFDPCHDTINHVPRADVTYNSSPVRVPDPVLVPLTIDLVERYGLDLPEGMVLEPKMGVIEIYKDGRILYDGEDISENIKDTCKDDSHSPESNEKPEPEETQDGDHTNAGGELPGMVSGGH
jgi:hypothetical protein